MPSAVYPGSLDPVTFGHIDAIADTARAFGNVVVALGVNPAKSYMFSLAEREALTRQATAHIPGVTVTSFSGMLVHYLVRNGQSIVVRGLRDETDYNDSVRQDTYGWQQTLAKDVTAFYVPARPGKEFVSSTSLKVVVKEQGNAVPLAPLSTLQATQARMLGQYLYGITCPSGAGKTTICRKFGEIAKRRGIPLVHIDLDRLGHEILSTAEEPLYRKVRADVVAVFGPKVANPDGSINRKQLGQMVFGNADKLAQLNAILHDPIFFRLNDLLRGKSGLFLVDAALLAESRRTPLVNNNVLLVEAPSDVLAKRLDQRDDLNAEQVARRVASQYTAEAKAVAVEGAIKEFNHGTLSRLVNTPGLQDRAVEEAFDTMLACVDIYGELRICAFLKTLGVADAAAAYKNIRMLYSGHDRFYHGLAHIVDGLNKLQQLQLDDKDAFVLAWLFHDAVYDSSRDDNEEESANLMQTLGRAWGLDAGLLERAVKLVMVTKHGKAVPQTPDEKHMVDVDFSVFGEVKEVYLQAEQGIRREYGWASDAQWIKGRSEFLKRLDAGSMFWHAEARERYAAQAEVNVRASLERLG